jgi:excisionase family DNA binding protein
VERRESETTAETAGFDLLARRPLSIDEAADYTGYSKKYLYRLTSENRIPYYKPQGGKLYFTTTDLDGFIFRNRHTADYEIREKAERIMVGGKA